MKDKHKVCQELVSDIAEKIGLDVSGLELVDAIRVLQRHEGHFDCFAKAGSGYCDQYECLFYEDCLKISSEQQD